MILQLTDQQRQALHDANDTGPVTLVDSATNTEFVLVRADLYRRPAEPMGDFDPREAYPFVDEVMAEDDAEDSALARYQDETLAGGEK
jgi:hypothetical protein